MLKKLTDPQLLTEVTEKGQYIRSRLAAMPHGLQGLQPFGLSDKPLSIEGNISLPPRRNPAARSYRLHIDPRYLDPRR